MAEGPGGSGEGSSGETPEAGLLGLVLIARFHQIPVTPEGLRHQFAPAAKNLGAEGNFSLDFSLGLTSF
jgi:hypothetical protein